MHMHKIMNNIKFISKVDKKQYYFDRLYKNSEPILKINKMSSKCIRNRANQHLVKFGMVHRN